MTRLVIEGELGDGTKIVVREDVNFGTIRVWLDGVEVHSTKFIELIA